VIKATPKTVGGKRAGSGRPATGRDPSRTFRLSDEFIAKVDAWGASQGGAPTRSEAIRRLVEIGLKATTTPSQRLHVTRAAQLAAQTIEEMVPSSVPAEAQRHRRLTKGPAEGSRNKRITAKELK
jgi:Arc/MetJ-type ribon-helix-helix transcriptional regulator